MNISYNNFPEKKKLFFLLSFVFTLVFYKPILTLSDQHIPPQEQQPTQTETIEYPSPKQIPSKKDTEIISPQDTQPSEGIEFPTKYEGTIQPGKKDLDIKIIQPSDGTQPEQTIPVPGVELPSTFTPTKPTKPIEEVPTSRVYRVVVSDCDTNQSVPGAKVEVSFFGNKLTQRSDRDGVAEFSNLYPIEVAEVEVKKQGYKKAEISTSIYESRTDKICVSQDLIVVKPTEPPVVVSGPREPRPTQPPIVVSQPTDTSQPTVSTPTQPMITDGVDQTTQTPSQPTETPSTTQEEQPPVAQTPEQEEPTYHAPKKDKHPINIHRQTKITSRKSEELIEEEPTYPIPYVGDRVATEEMIDYHMNKVANLLRKQEQARQASIDIPDQYKTTQIRTNENMPDYIPNQILLLLKGHSDKKIAIKDLENIYQMKLLGSFTLESIDSTLALFEIPDPTNIQTLIDRLEADPRVSSPQPNYYYKSSSDKYLQYGIHKIKADKAHTIATGRGVKVAVIDTGVDYRHSALAGKVILKVDYVSSDEDSFTYDPHGTSIAGIIAATANNGAGTIGVSPDVAIISVKACWSDLDDPTKATCSSDKLARAIDFSILNKANIINFSLGGPRDSLISRLISKAVDESIIVVAAGGNGGPLGKPVFPAALDDVIAVSATDASDALYISSTRGEYIDISAPGVDIFGPAPGNSWQILSGTSMAAAHVSGTIALLLQTKQELSTSQVKHILSSTAVDLGKPGKDLEFGEGRIDAYRALQKLLTPTASLH